MSARGASFWRQAGEAVFLALAFVLPMAFYMRTYDSATVKNTALQLGALALTFAWLLKGLERGRWEVPEKAWPLLAPALALLGWAGLRFCAAPYKLAALDGFLRLVLSLAVYCVAVLEFGGTDTVRRFKGWLTGAAWVACLYGLCQVLGFDPWIWAGAFGEDVFSTFANPDLFGLFLAGLLPLVLAGLLDDERPTLLKVSDLVLLTLMSGNVVWTGSGEALISFALSGMVAASALPLLFPSKATWKAAALAGAVAVATFASGWSANGTGFERNLLHEMEFKRHTWAATLRMAGERPLTGFGPGSFQVHYPRFRPPEVIRLEAEHNTKTAHPESQSLELAAELGLTGVALYLWLFASVLGAAAKAAGRFLRQGASSERLYAAGLAAATASLLVTSQFALAAHFAAPGWLLWACAGLLGGLTTLSGAEKIAVAPIPLSEAGRMRLYAPALASFAALAFFPAAWFRSDIEHNLAVAYSKQLRWPEAIEHYDRVRPGAPAYVMAQYFKGNILLETQRPKEALEQYAYLQSLSPDYVQVHYQTALAYAKLGDHAAAMASLARSRALDPLFVPTFERWSQEARAAGDLAQARRAVFEALALEPGQPAHWKALSEIYLKEKRMLASKRMRREAARLTAVQQGGGG